MNDMRSPVAVPDWSRGKPLRVGPWTLGLYQPSPETRGYWEGVQRDELLIKRCRACGSLHHPRRIACTSCRATDLEWTKASGRGRVYSYSVIHRAVVPELRGSVPYTVGIVQLEEGVHLFTRFFAPDGAPVAIDDPVTVAFRMLEGGEYLPVFVKTGAVA